MLMPEDDVKVSGPTKTYIDKKTDSGVDLERVFCGFCGSPVYSKTPQAPGKLCKSTPLGMRLLLYSRSNTAGPFKKPLQSLCHC